jgi:hypothetical protein
MERKSLFKRPEREPAQTFALTVESYDVRANPPHVKGKRVDNGEDVTVFLRTDFEMNKGKFKRSEIKDFAAERRDRQHPGTVEGGILVVQEAIKQPNGSFGARWLQSLSHHPGEAFVFHGTVHVSPVKQAAGSGKDYSLMTVLHDADFSQLPPDVADLLKATDPFKVTGSEMLREAATAMLEDGLGVGVRFVDPDNSFDSTYLKRKKDESIEQAVSNFMAEIAEILPAVDAGEMTCEVVPYSTIWAGPATLDVMLNNRPAQQRLARFNESRTVIRKEQGREVEKTYNVQLFRPAIVAVRVTEPDEKTGLRSVYFSHFDPLNTRYPSEYLHNALAYAQSPLLSPTPPRPEPRQEQAAPANNSNQRQQGSASNQQRQQQSSRQEASDSGFGAFDGDDMPGMSDDDLMAAATAGNDIGDERDPRPDPTDNLIEQPEPAAAPAPAARRYNSRR